MDHVAGPENAGPEMTDLDISKLANKATVN